MESPSGDQLAEMTPGRSADISPVATFHTDNSGRAEASSGWRRKRTWEPSGDQSTKDLQGEAQVISSLPGKTSPICGRAPLVTTKEERSGLQA